MSALTTELTLQNAENVMMCPLYMLAATYVSFPVDFTTSIFNEAEHEVRRICCYRPEGLAPNAPLNMPVMFEIVGRIATVDCFLTARGDEGILGEDRVALASCWIEPAPVWKLGAVEY